MVQPVSDYDTDMDLVEVTALGTCAPEAVLKHSCHQLHIHKQSHLS